jgi:cellobiose-specific phosphotransferase system component IIA
MIRSKTISLAVIPFTLMLAAGCATTGDLDAVRKLAQEAKDSADRANQKADQALVEAANAQRAADEAKASAGQANDKVDRAFKKAVQK